MLSFLVRELRQEAVGARIEKIHQPTREELVLSLRGRQGDESPNQQQVFQRGAPLKNGSFSPDKKKKLLLSATANAPRVSLIAQAPENPAAPPMFCMLLRKLLTGTRLTDITQPGLERVLFLAFAGFNELGDAVTYRLAAEIMGKHSNLILLDGSGKIIDAIKRIDASESSVRLTLPGVTYALPPSQGKLDITISPVSELLPRLNANPELPLEKRLLTHLQGCSPLICRELAFSGETPEGVVRALEKVSLALSQPPTPWMITDPDGKPLDISFMDITQYGSAAASVAFENFSALLEGFYAQRDRQNRMKIKTAGLLKTVQTARDRTARKLGFQRQDLQKSADRAGLRIKGELINAHLNSIPKGAAFCEVPDYYDDMNLLRIALDPRLSPAQNAQHYFKAYRKACTAEQMLIGLIEKGEQELIYLDSVLEAIGRATGERELSEIREELCGQGRLRAQKGHKKLPASLPPFEFVSDDGFTVLVGRNNRQNDLLSLKFARGKDIWLHAKGLPGAHVIVVSHGADVPEGTLLLAAQLAAGHSRARDSAQVPVDYTFAKQVKKPAGAKPGMVTYNQHKTLYVTPRKP